MFRRATAVGVSDPREIVVATHGHCFDGMASAALFTFLRGALSPGKSICFRYRSCGYGPGMQTIPEAWLDGDENAILDFRYTHSKALSWYFDHHITAFGSEKEKRRALALGLLARAAERPDEPSRRVYYEPTYGSCTKLIADIAKSDFGIQNEMLDPLVTWADVIDSARFLSAGAAVDRAEPVLRFASVVEHHGDGAFLATFVPRLLARPLEEVASCAEVNELWKPLAIAQDNFLARIKKNGRVMGSVVFVDLSDAPLEGGAKFVTYAHFPMCVYSVTLLRSKWHYKVSVGYNPWCGRERRHDIAAICRRYDGGGHPVVGAASFPLSELQRAKEVALAIVRELDT